MTIEDLEELLELTREQIINQGRGHEDENLLQTEIMIEQAIIDEKLIEWNITH